jgi:parvulin-like peptidyl-prolyl isomerase
MVGQPESPLASGTANAIVPPHKQRINRRDPWRVPLGSWPMRAWQRHSHRLFAVALTAWQLTLGGCQPKEVRPSTAGLSSDFVSLASLAGNDAPATLTRGQKSDSVAGILEIRADDPGSREYRAGRIRAVVNGDAILDEEVLAAAYQQLVGVRSEKEKAEILNTKLQELIEREVVLQDAMARLGNRGGGRIIKELQKFAEKEFERQWLHKMMRANKYETEEEFKKFLRDNGMQLELIRRQWERNFIAMEYVRSRIEPSLNRVGHLQVEDYYEKHPDEFKIEDSIVWQDIFIAKARHPSPAAARQLAETLLSRIRKGEDFARLAKEYDNGDSSLRENAEGIGNKRGEIRPPEAEKVLWAMQAGQSELIELEFGYHIVKVVERKYTGVKPFDDEVQKEIKDKLKNQIFQTEMKRLVNELKRRAIIEIGTEIK